MSAKPPIELNEREQAVLLAMFLSHPTPFDYDKEEFAARLGYKSAKSTEDSIRPLKKKLAAALSGQGTDSSTTAVTPSPTVAKTPRKRKAAGSASSATSRKTAKTGKGKDAAPNLKTEDEDVEIKNEDRDEDEDAGVGGSLDDDRGDSVIGM